MLGSKCVGYQLLNLREFTIMSNKFIKTFLTLAILSIIGAKHANAQDQGTDEKAMQTRSYTIPEDLKQQMLENIKKNRGVKDGSQTEDAGASDNTSGKSRQAGAKQEDSGETGTGKTASSEKKVWKKYKDLASGITEEEAPYEEAEESSEEDEQTETAQDDSGSSDMAAILQNYKSHNNAQMQTRSFSIPEAIEKQKEANVADSDSENTEDQEEAAGEKPEIRKHKKISPKKPAKKKQKKETKISIKTND